MKRLMVSMLVLLAVLGVVACAETTPTALPLPTATPVALSAKAAPPSPSTTAVVSPTVMLAEVAPPPVPTATPTRQPPPVPTATPTSAPSATITPAPLPTATPRPSFTPTHTATPTPPLAIQHFAADVKDEGGGKRITFTWESSGAVSGAITTFAQPSSPVTWAVPASGTYAVQVADEAVVPNPLATLMVTDGTGKWVSSSLRLAWPCRHTFFFSPAPTDVCANPAQTTAAAEQPFQYGRMLWLQKLGTDPSQLIYVLYTSGRFDVFTDLWREGDPTADTGSAPAGLFQPTRGFGQIWRMNPTVRERVGWATALEQGFTATVQYAHLSSSPTRLYIRALDGRVAALETRTGYWQFVETAVARPSPTPVRFSVSVAPSALTLPAGASALLTARIPEWSPALPSPRWSVAGLPAGATASLLPAGVPADTTVVISTACSLVPGAYDLDLRAEIGQSAVSVRLALSVVGPLLESRPGTLTGSFGAYDITIRRGGPSTLTHGPWTTLHFCDSSRPRTLRVTLQSVGSVAGPALATPPRFTLLRVFSFPVPGVLQTMGGGYVPNAEQVAASDGWSLEWPIRGGIYVLAFERSPFEDTQPPEQRPSTVTYTVQIDQ